LTCPGGDNQWFGLVIGHIAHVSHAGSDLWRECDKNQLWFVQPPSQNPTRWHTHRANQFHAHPFHPLLTCPYGDNQWFWAGYIAHVSCMLGQICGQCMT
jgi:hypothetical protein